MNAAQTPSPRTVSSAGLVMMRLTVLIGCVSGAATVAAMIAYRASGTEGVAAAVLAASVCLTGATAALVMSTTLTERSLAMITMMLAGMLVRMGLPLAAALIVHVGAPGLENAGFLYYLLIFYALCLAIEIPLSLRAQHVATSPHPRTP